MPPFIEDTAGGVTASSQPSLPTSGDSSQNVSTQSVSLPNDAAASPHPPSEPAAPPPAAPAAWDNLPKSWKKDYESHWGQLPPEVRQYIHEREQQAFRGISSYRQGHERWNQATQPFQEIMTQNPDVDPVQLVQTLAQNHIRLATASPAERRTLLQDLAKHYGVDFAQAAAAGPQNQSGQQVPPGPQGQPFTPEQVQYLQQFLGPLAGQVQAAYRFSQEQRMAEASTSVDKFFSNPENVYAEDVAQDMLQLLQARKADSLEDAYEMAIMRNPEVKAKYLADLAAKARPPAPPLQLNVRSSGTPASTPKPATMDESINSVIRKHYG